METGAEISVEQALDMVSTGFDVLAEHGASFHDPAELSDVIPGLVAQAKENVMTRRRRPS